MGNALFIGGLAAYVRGGPDIEPSVQGGAKIARAIASLTAAAEADWRRALVLS